MATRKPDSLNLEPGRDPLAGLENHPLFRDLPSAQAKQHADAEALRLAQARLRRAEQQVVELQQQLDASIQEKRRLLRELDEMERRLTANRPQQSISPVDWETYAAFFNDQAASTKITFNNVPIELKTFLTVTKAALHAEAGLQLTERDQVVCALAALRIMLGAIPDPAAFVANLPGQGRSNLPARFCTTLLAQLAAKLAADPLQ